MVLLATIDDPAVITLILTHLGLSLDRGCVCSPIRCRLLENVSRQLKAVAIYLVYEAAEKVLHGGRESSCESY